MKLLRVIRRVFIVLIILSLSISIYLLFFRKVEVINTNQVIDRINLPELSDVDAEKRNYDSVEKVDYKNELQEYSYFKDSIPDESSSINTLKKLFNIVGNDLIYQANDLNKYIPILYSEKYEEFDAKVIFQKLDEVLKENSIYSLVVDTSLQTNMESYSSLLKLISDKFEIGILLNPRVADRENLNTYKSYNPSITKLLDIPELNKIVSNFYIEGYGYTPDLALLPGPTSKLDYSEDILQYYISKGADRNKLYLGINQTQFEWPDRFYENDIAKNILSDERVAKINKDNTSSFSNVIENLNTDSYGFNPSQDGKLNLVTFPSGEFIERQVDLARSYGIKGVFYKY